MAEHAGRGGHMTAAWLATARQLASIAWLGRLIVVDSRLCTDDDTHLEITTPDAEGRYTIGWGLDLGRRRRRRRAHDPRR